MQHVEVIRLSLGAAAAFSVIRGPGYVKLFLNTDHLPDRPLTDSEREAGLQDWLRIAGVDVTEQKTG